ncbi:MAG TPA: RNA polymerase sigma factor [Polyangiales bacterium]|nr:RNA polymerase sigma factor [Polyangiales bacterium]
MTTAQPVEAVDAQSLGDEALVQRLLRGETPLFEVLIRRHNQRLFRVARAIVRDGDEAEDVMQEAYVQAFSKLAQFEGRAKFSTWLTRIAVHEALARVRKRRPAVDADGEPMESDLPSPEDNASRHELAALLEPLVDALPEAFRVVFVMRAAEGLSAAECAECLDIPEETVRTRYFRARRMLQLELESKLLASGEKLYDFHLRRCDRVVAAVFARISSRPPL